MNKLLSSTVVFLSLFTPLTGEENTQIREILITGNDAMQFDLKKFEAKPGETIRLTFKNIGSLPKTAMGHNLVVLKKDVHALSFGQKVLASGGSASNPLPKSLLGDIIAHTNLLGPGESESITFNTPNQSGEYEYVCTFPGHFAMMRGIMVVK